MNNKMKANLSWVKEHPTETAVAIGAPCAVIIALVVTFPGFLSGVGALLLLGTLGWALHDPTPARSAQSTVSDHGYLQCYKLLDRILRKYEDVWHVVPQADPARMAPCWPPLIQKGNVEVIRAEIDKRSGCDTLPAEDFARELRRAIEFELAGGYGEGIPFASPDNQVPIFFPLDVDETPRAYILDIAYLGTRSQYDKVSQIMQSRQQQRHALRHPIQVDFQDEDF